MKLNIILPLLLLTLMVQNNIAQNKIEQIINNSLNEFKSKYLLPEEDWKNIKNTYLIYEDEIYLTNQFLAKATEYCKMVNPILNINLKPNELFEYTINDIYLLSLKVLRKNIDMVNEAFEKGTQKEYFDSEYFSTLTNDLVNIIERFNFPKAHFSNIPSDSISQKSVLITDFFKSDKPLSIIVTTDFKNQEELLRFERFFTKDFLYNEVVVYTSKVNLFNIGNYLFDLRWGLGHYRAFMFKNYNYYSIGNIAFQLRYNLAESIEDGDIIINKTEGKLTKKRKITPDLVFNFWFGPKIGAIKYNENNFNYYFNLLDEFELNVGITYLPTFGLLPNLGCGIKSNKYGTSFFLTMSFRLDHEKITKNVFVEQSK